MSDGAPSQDRPNYLWDRRWLVAGLGGLILLALAASVATGHRAWQWDLFWWGVAVGVVAALIIARGTRVTRGPNNHPGGQAAGTTPTHHPGPVVGAPRCRGRVHVSHQRHRGARHRA